MRQITGSFAQADSYRCSGICVLGVLGSHYILLVHKVWSIGVPMEVRLALFALCAFRSRRV
jgi:hypothetical protein